MSTPYALVSSVQTPVRGDKALLLALSRWLETRALADPPGAVAAALQDARHLTPSTREAYARLAATGAKVVLHARGLQTWLAPGVVGVDLDDDDPLVDEWVVVVPSPSAPTVLAATDLAEPWDDDLDRCFLYAVSHDAEVVQACLDLLLQGVRAGPEVWQAGAGR